MDSASVWGSGMWPNLLWNSIWANLDGSFPHSFSVKKAVSYVTDDHRKHWKDYDFLMNSFNLTKTQWEKYSLCFMGQNIRTVKLKNLPIVMWLNSSIKPGFKPRQFGSIAYTSTLNCPPRIKYMLDASLSQTLKCWYEKTHDFNRTYSIHAVKDIQGSWRDHLYRHLRALCVDSGGKITDCWVLTHS